MEKQIIVPDQIFTVDNVLSKEECDACIHLSEDLGYGDAPITTSSGFAIEHDKRNNERVMLDDFELAKKLWKRIESFVPTPLDERNVIGLNERFRYYRYDPRQTFKWHFDGSFRRENGEKSQLTFMVYLNEDFTGGETRFDLRRPHFGQVVRPKTGMALLFVHHLYHEGAIVRSGRKYVLRSDVMYGPEAKTA